MNHFAKGITDNLDRQTLREKRDIIKLLIEKIEVDAIHHEIKAYNSDEAWQMSVALERLLECKMTHSYCAKN